MFLCFCAHTSAGFSWEYVCVWGGGGGGEEDKATLWRGRIAPLTSIGVEKVRGKRHELVIRDTGKSSPRK